MGHRRFDRLRAGLSGGRRPSEKEVEKFFGGFKILGAKPTPRDLAAPPDWKEFKAPTGDFHAVMPVGRTSSPEVVFLQGVKYPVTYVKKYESHDPGLKITVIVVRFVPGTPEAERERTLRVLVGSPRPTPEKSEKVRWAGRDADELSFAPPLASVARLAHDDTAGYAALVHGGASPPDPALVKLFLDSFAYDKK